MSFFDKVGNFFKNDVSGFFTKTIPSTASKVWEGVKPAVSTVYGDVKSGISALHQDGRDLVSGYGALYGKVVDKGADVIKGAEDTVGSLGQSLSLPLVLAGGAFAIYYLNKV